MTNEPKTFSMLHHIDVLAAPELAYRLINDVAEWPRFFPPCRGARIVEQFGNIVVIEVSADVGGETRTWRSRRRVSIDDYLVEFEQEDPFPPLASMTGHWRVIPRVGDQCTVELEHSFTTDAEVAAKGKPPRSVEDAVAWIRRVCDSNSDAELSAFKARCEELQADAPSASPGGVSGISGDLIFEDSLWIDAPREQVFDKLWAVESWPRLLPHVVSVDVLESSPDRHRFSMRTQGEGGTHTTESIRHAEGRRQISYQQLVHPPLLRKHHGRWVLDDEAGGTRVRSQHTISIAPEHIPSALGRAYSPEQALVLMRHFIGNHSMKTLRTLEELFAQEPATQAGARP